MFVFTGFSTKSQTDPNGSTADRYVSDNDSHESFNDTDVSGSEICNSLEEGKKY